LVLPIYYKKICKNHLNTAAVYFFREMSNTGELRNAAHGLVWLIRQSKNENLTKEAVNQLKDIRMTALTSSRPSSQNLIELIDEYIDEANEYNGFHAYQVADVMDDPSNMKGPITGILLFLFTLFIVSLYISIVNSAIRMG
jgi:hypothetical protein